MQATVYSTASESNAISSVHSSLIQQFMLRHTGNALRDDQVYLLESRLQRIAMALGYNSVGELVTAASVPFPSAKLASALIEALTTHETSFFGDSAFWQTLQHDVLTKLIDRTRSGKHVRIWCAACSTGQEPYSLAILLREMAPTQFKNVEIIATDIAEPTLEHARSGFYSPLEVNHGLDSKRLAANFTLAKDSFRIKEEISGAITWRIHNLLGTNAEPNKCDLVLCRNVLMYFNEIDRTSALKRLIAAATVDGFIGVGSNESISEPRLTLISSGLYLKSK